MNLLVACGLAPSKGEARRLVQQGGVSAKDPKGSFDCFTRLVQERILTPGLRSAICGGCQWNSICSAQPRTSIRSMAASCFWARASSLRRGRRSSTGQ